MTAIRRPSLVLVSAAVLMGSVAAFAEEGAGFIPIPLLQFGLGVAESPRDVATTLQILALLTVLSVAPGILLMMTCFTRLLIVLGFVQRAIGLQQTPPAQVISSLALFLTLFIILWVGKYWLVKHFKKILFVKVIIIVFGRLFFFGSFLFLWFCLRL